MRRGFGLIGVVLTGILLAVVGVVSYDAGWSAGAATHVVEGATSGAVAPYYYYAPHFFGFGLFGFFFALFILFVLFGFLRMALWGRGWGYGGWGRGYGMKGGGFGGGIPPAIDERMQEWHRKAHGEPTPTPPPPPGQTQV